jgi:hypothetical protein
MKPGHLKPLTKILPFRQKDGWNWAQVRVGSED